ncbi:MAG: riboflavin synthase [Armatimonadota bacterium]|jgi:riboflavin synthase
MFTGLIEEMGTVRSLARGAVGKLVVTCEKTAAEIAVGDSVAVNGACLTATSINGSEVCFDAVAETLSRTTLGDLRAPDKVNLETSLKAGKALGGHFVLGHVDGVGTIDSVQSIGESKVIRFRAPGNVLRYVVEKGSIAIDGISLTVASCDDSGFEIAVIPHTLEATTLQSKRPGDKVNLETDILGKYVEKFLGKETGSVTEDLLRQAGFR